MSTVYPETSQQLWRMAADQGIDFLDVTMSGSTPVAEKGFANAVRWR
jgi:3-hydroxyisobutyrate dehydrogenase-like beta-hydroxyacid dehydrogenase